MSLADKLTDTSCRSLAGRQPRFARTIAATMMPRRLPLRPDTVTFLRPLPSDGPARVAPVGWTRKTFAIAVHMACLGLFGLIVVWPVASPIARGELAREFKPVLEALGSWTP